MNLCFSLKDVYHDLEEMGHLIEELETIPHMELKGFSSLQNSKPSTLSWMRNQELDWDTIHSSVVLCDKDARVPSSHKAILIPVKEPRKAFADLLRKQTHTPQQSHIHPTAIIPASCELGEHVSIGPYTVLGEGVKIGSHTIIRSFVTLHDHVTIGDSCLVGSHSCIGEEGFGFERNENQEPQRIPHIGSVCIGNHVEVGAHVTIARGVLDSTLIQDHVKIDDQVMIAHNVSVGRSTMIAGCADVSGSVSIGERVWVGPNCSIINKVSIGDDAFIGIGATVMKSVAPRSTVSGPPAKKIH